MTTLKKILLATVLSSFSFLAWATPITQSTSPASSDSYWYGNGWAHQQLGSITLASGTTLISDLTSTVTLMDQGWGGQSFNNGVFVGLFNNGVNIWSKRVAGANHSWTTQTYDITSDLPALNSLNVAIAGIDWLSSPLVTINMIATPFAWSGWELHTRNASFSVTSAVPVPATLTLLGLGLVGLGFSHRRARKNQNH